MSLLPRASRTIRKLPFPSPLSRQCLFHPRPRYLTSTPHPSAATQSSLLSSDSKPPPKSTHTPSEIHHVSLHRLHETQRAYYRRRTYYAASGLLLGLIGLYITATSIDLPPPTAKLDSLSSTPPFPSTKPIILSADSDDQELVPTGTSTIPTFPRTLTFSDNISEPPTEYQLLGLGIRTVSFLGIQVYVLGMYIAVPDIATLQSMLIKRIAGSGASTLVSGETDDLRKVLFDEVEGEKVWNEVLKESGVRMLVRIVPTKNTDFHHLRDAWVRGLTARAQKDRGGEFGEEGFAMAVKEFKGLFNRGGIPKGRELLLVRKGNGELVVWYEEKEGRRVKVGGVGDERVGRSIWLGYLAGKNVSSEEARKNIVEGVMGFVERPVGTVVQQVRV